jgi:predicted MFS family arabinose efflux permease
MIIGAYRSAFAGLPRPVWLLALTNLINRSGTMVLPFLSLYFTHELSFGPSQAGRLLGLYGVGAMIGAYVGGWLSDRIGALRVQVISFLATGAGFVVLGQVRGFAAIAVTVALVSIVAEAFRPALFVAVTQVSDESIRTRSFSLLRLSTNVGMAIGPSIGGFLATRHYNLLFWADALTCWAAAVLIMLTLRSSLSGPVRDEAPASTGQAHHSPWRDPPYLAFLILSVVLATAFFQLWTTFSIFMKQHFHYSERGIGGLFAFNPVLIVMFEMLLVKRLEHRDNLRVAGLGSLLIGVSFAILPLSSAALVPVAVMALLTLGEMLALPMLNAVVGKRAPSGSTGRYMGAYTLAFGVAFAISPLVGTAVYERLGPQSLWFGVGLLGVVAWIGFSLLAKRFYGCR